MTHTTRKVGTSGLVSSGKQLSLTRDDRFT
jgi:hypothetical protein